MENTKTAELLKDLKKGVTEMVEDGRYVEFLDVFAKFHQYSFSNMMLIHFQRKNAGRVAGFKAWQTKFGRHVKKGAKAIWIIAPNTRKGKKTEYDDNGNAIEKEFTYVSSFRAVPVFSEYDTEGKELPEIENLVKDLSGDVANYEKTLKALEKATTAKITYDEIEEDGCKGYFVPESNIIVIRKGMNQAETVSCLVHEIAHSILHCKGGDEENVSRGTKELEADSVAYIVCRMLGFDTGEWTFGYVSTWAKENTMETLCNKLDIIGKTSDKIINAMA